MLVLKCHAILAKTPDQDVKTSSITAVAYSPPENGPSIVDTQTQHRNEHVFGYNDANLLC